VGRLPGRLVTFNVRSQWTQSRGRLLTILIVTAVLATGVVLAKDLGRGTSKGAVAVPRLISLPAPDVRDLLRHVGLTGDPVFLGWASSGLPWGAVSSQAPRAGTMVAAGSRVRFGFYLSDPGGLMPAAWPHHLSGRLDVQGSYSNPAKTGTLVSKSELTFGPITSRSFVGANGYALATIDGFQYPIATSNAGASWRIAGLWFAGAWADAAAFASSIRTYSQTVAVAFTPSENIFYVTTDDGGHWFSTNFPGNVVKVSGHSLKGLAGASITVEVTNWAGARKTATYRTVDSGRSWLLIGQGGVSGFTVVPNLSGMTVAQASRALSEVGFVETVAHLFGPKSSPEIVVSQSPSPGSVAERGVTVAVAVPH
jgi:PASTA domain